MAKMKDLVIDILEAYDEEHLPVSVIAERFGVSVAEVLQVIEVWELESN